MRKMIAILLLLTLTLSLCACGKDGGDNEDASGETGVETLIKGKFSVGYAKMDITPDEGVPLGSYGNELERVSNSLLEYIYAIAVAITDAEGNTLLLITTDLSWGTPEMATIIRQQVKALYGFESDQVILGGTHNHNAPGYGCNDARITRYMDKWYKQVMEAIELALDDRKPAEMYIANTETESLTFVRRYWLQNGNLKGDNWNDYDYSPIVGHETDADESMRLVKFVREGGKDVMMINWQSHANYVGATLNLSADFVGGLRDKVDKEMDCLSVYYQGAAGNLNPTSRIEKENRSSDRREHGELVADYAIAAKDSFQKVETGLVQTYQYTFVGEVNHEDDKLINQAKWIYNAYQGGTSAKECATMGQEYGINNWRHASAIINRYNSGTTRNMELNAFSIGDVAFVTMPAEFFDESGKQIREGSPFKMTVIMGYTVGGGTYLPTAQGFENKGYGSFNCYYVPGTAELCVSQYLTMLNDLYSR